MDTPVLSQVLFQHIYRGIDSDFGNLRYNTDYECFPNSVSPAPVLVRIIENTYRVTDAWYTHL